MNKPKPNKQDQEKRVAFFNSICPVGGKVSVRKDDATAIITTTRSKAQMMCGMAVIWLDGISGCYALERVSPICSEPKDYEEQEQLEADAARGG